MRIHECSAVVKHYKFGEPCCDQIKALIHTGTIRIEPVLLPKVVLINYHIHYCPFCGEGFEIK